MDQPNPAELRQAFVRASVLRAGIAVTELLVRSNRSRSASRTDSAIASGGPEARRCLRIGEQDGGGVAATQALGLVQGRAQSDRDDRVLEGSREEWWACALPVATQGPDARRRAGRGCANGRAARGVFAAQSETLRSEGAEQPPATAAAPARGPPRSRSPRPRRRERSPTGRRAPPYGAPARRSEGRGESGFPLMRGCAIAQHV